EVTLQKACGGAQIIAGSCIDDRGTSSGMDHEGIDVDPPHRPKSLAQQPMRRVEIDIAHHVEAAVEISVADDGDDDISDLAMIDAGNLPSGLRSHGGTHLRAGGAARLFGTVNSTVSELRHRGERSPDLSAVGRARGCGIAHRMV